MDTATFFKPQFYAHALYVKNEGTIEFETTGGSLSLQSGAMTDDITFTLPNTLGQAGQYLKTDGNGVMMWDNAPSGTVGGNAYEIQFNDGDNGFTGSPNFTIHGNRMYVGNSSSSSRIVFSGGDDSQEINCYIRSASPNYLTIYAENLDLNGINVDVNATGNFQAIADSAITIESHLNDISAINIRATGDTDGSITATAKGYIQLVSESSNLNSAIQLRSINGGITFDSRKILYNTMNVSIGDGENYINSRTAFGSEFVPSSSVLYFFVDQVLTGGDFYCDLSQYGSEGQILKMLFDNSNVSNVNLYVYFGANTLVSGSGLHNYLYFTALGQSSELICKLDSNTNKRWFILNTGAGIA